MCESAGIATGALNVDYEPEYRDGEFFDAHPFVYFKAERFACRICGFHLDSVVEWKAVGMASRWEVEGVDWREIDPPLNEDQIAAAEDGANKKTRDSGLPQSLSTRAEGQEPVLLTRLLTRLP